MVALIVFIFTKKLLPLPHSFGVIERRADSLDVINEGVWKRRNDTRIEKTHGKNSVGKTPV